MQGSKLSQVKDRSLPRPLGVFAQLIALVLGDEGCLDTIGVRVEMRGIEDFGVFRGVGSKLW